MNEKRKPAHGGNHERVAGMETAAALTGATISHAHSITEGKERQLPKLQVSDLLPHERENALKLRDLKELFSVDSRTIRSLIQRERQHVPILSDNLSGYWISDDAAEVQKFTASMRHRAVNANLKMSVFAEKECHFSSDSIQAYTALTTTSLVGLKPVKP